MSKGRLTREEVARALGYHTQTLERWEINGIGPHCLKQGNRTEYRARDVQQWVRDRLNHYARRDDGKNQA